ncbi:hypothetical protein Sjap_007889 [Stephania japonica]|uniref:Uncharacterized protein n=1 Tax=Stephania japonica TaxID=461633 RepID=A0AAP0JQP9_9MAGN
MPHRWSRVCVLHLPPSYLDSLPPPPRATTVIDTDVGGIARKLNESMRLILTTFVGVVFGFFIGVSFSSISVSKVGFFLYLSKLLLRLNTCNNIFKIFF